MMEYKGYTAGPIDFNPEENTFSGIVSGLKDVVHFEGSTAKELARAFRESFDGYLKYSEEAGRQPGKLPDLVVD
jgi:predicted HicB family RNase H-like nuclease